jgi:hypothetical protein
VKDKTPRCKITIRQKYGKRKQHVRKDGKVTCTMSSCRRIAHNHACGGHWPIRAVAW